MKRGAGSRLLFPGLLICLVIVSLAILMPAAAGQDEPVRETLNDAYVVQHTLEQLEPNLKTQQKRIKGLSKKVMDIMHHNTKKTTGNVKSNIDQVIRTGKKP